MAIRFVALPSDAVRAVRNGAPDANSMPAERMLRYGAVAASCRFPKQNFL